MRLIVLLMIIASVLITEYLYAQEATKINGFFLDGNTSVGYARSITPTTGITTRYGNVNSGIRLGNKFFVKEDQNYSLGMNMYWISTSFGYDFFSDLVVSPLNIGISNVWLKNGVMYELNLNGGASFFIEEPVYDDGLGLGFLINPEFIRRKGRFRFGLGYQFTFYEVNNSASFIQRKNHEIVLTFGLHQK